MDITKNIDIHSAMYEGVKTYFRGYDLSARDSDALYIQIRKNLIKELK